MKKKKRNTLVYQSLLSVDPASSFLIRAKILTSLLEDLVANNIPRKCGIEAFLLVHINKKYIA